MDDDVRVIETAVRVDDEEGGVFTKRPFQVLVVLDVARRDEERAGEFFHHIVRRRLAFDGRPCLACAVLVETLTGDGTDRGKGPGRVLGPVKVSHARWGDDVVAEGEEEKIRRAP